jgi:polysaccharide export outer membrane protein
MRPNRFLIVLLAALAVTGCARRGAHAPYRYMPVAQAYQAPAYQTPAYHAPAYQAPASRAQPVYQAAPAPSYQVPAPVYQAAAPASQPSCPAHGCGSQSSASYTGVVDTTYMLDSGDRLRITVFGQEGLTNSDAVDAAGNITMPLIGAVPARGLTTEQLSQSIAERLRQGYIREPHLALEIEAYRPFFILGEVTTPGQYAYVANMTVENAVAIAGGFGPRAEKSKVTLTRNQNGQVVKATVGPTYLIRPGDTLRIQERWF